MVRRCDLPAAALLRAYGGPGGHADGYCVDVAGTVSQARFVEAFYTTWLFRIERALLAVFARRPSRAADARALATGAGEAFAAWTVEARTADQLLLAAMLGRTRSWLMTSPVEGNTRLYFGSAVLPRRTSTGTGSMGVVFHSLLGFHAMYSRALLAAAVRRIARTTP